MTKISVILPVLDGAATLQRALESLLAQTFTDFEVLIVDDGSTDSSREIAQACALKDSRFRLIALESNHGVSFARNKALEQARGAWIATLDADDWYEPQRLEKMFSMAEVLQADAVIDNLRIFDHAASAIVEETHFGAKEKPERLTPETFFAKDTPFSRWAIGYARPLARTSFLKDRHLCYDERFHLGEDFLFLAEILLRGGDVYALPFASYIHVPRLSPSTGELSPFSRSIYEPEHIALACRTLLARYEDEVEPEARTAIKRRLGLFTALSRAHEIRRLWARGHKIAAILQLALNPAALLLGAELFARRRIKQFPCIAERLRER